MIQTVYVLEIVRVGSTVRGHFAQTLGAAQRAAGRYYLEGRWAPVTDGGRVVSRLLDARGREVGRVVREGLEYG